MGGGSRGPSEQCPFSLQVAGLGTCGRVFFLSFWPLGSAHTAEAMGCPRVYLGCRRGAPGAPSSACALGGGGQWGATVLLGARGGGRAFSAPSPAGVCFVSGSVSGRIPALPAGLLRGGAPAFSQVRWPRPRLGEHICGLRGTAVTLVSRFGATSGVSRDRQGFIFSGTSAEVFVPWGCLKERRVSRGERLVFGQRARGTRPGALGLGGRPCCLDGGGCQARRPPAAPWPGGWGSVLSPRMESVSRQLPACLGDFAQGLTV